MPKDPDEQGDPSCADRSLVGRLICCEERCKGSNGGLEEALGASQPELLHKPLHPPWEETSGQGCVLG